MNSLSDDALVKNFEKLDKNSLLNAEKVYPLWSQIITSSATLMSRFTLSIVILEDQKFHVYGKFHHGAYQNLTIKSLLKPNALSTEFYEYLSNYRETARNLIFKEIFMSDVISTLKHFNLENITKLVLIKCEHEPMKMKKIDLPNLTHLELTHSTEFLQNIKIHRVNVLKISNRPCIRKTLNPNIAKRLNVILKNCDTLTDLTLSKFNNRSTRLHLNIDEFKFNLVSLTVEGTFMRNLNEFLLSQKDTLRNLAVNYINQNAELLKAIFYKLKLTQLEIDVKMMPENFPMHNQNTTIRQLILRKFRISRTKDVRMYPVVFLERLVRNAISKEKAKKIISICSAVEEISIHYFDSEDLLEEVSLSMKNLKVLRLEILPSNISAVVQFINLECLEINEINDNDELRGMIFLATYSPKLRYIRVNKIKNNAFNENVFIEIIKNVKNLEEFHIGSDCHFTCKMIEAVKRAKRLGRPLKKLTMERKMRSVYYANNIEIKDLKISFCDDLRKVFTSFTTNSKLNGMEKEANGVVKVFNENKRSLKII